MVAISIGAEPVVALTDEDHRTEVGHRYDGINRELGFSRELIYFGSIAVLEVDTLRSLELSVVCVNPKFLTAFLSNSLEMTRLSLHKVLFNSDLDEEMSSFLSAVKTRKERPQAANIVITLCEIHRPSSHGQFSASDSEISAWIEEGPGSGFLEKALASFGPYSPIGLGVDYDSDTLSEAEYNADFYGKFGGRVEGLEDRLGLRISD